ncbi:MAG: hypothetical protein LBU65_02905 [Planctomycetaceae bacterium]|jgi:dissimilatory sulfite reductase (desulfoviridin) alpha/beta subunit|nr:hypothetical protein [Planctomycetaceae bacterium]
MSNKPSKITDAEIAALKENAIFAERGMTHFSARFLVVGGLMTTDKLRAVAAIADRYGDGTVHFTTRQGVEIPHIPYAKLDKMRTAVAKLPLEPARSGKCVRAIVACPGTYCKLGNIDTQKLATVLFKKFGKRGKLPHKFKIAVCGCKHCCSKPHENDLGVMGIATGFVVFVGGMAGETPRWGDKLPFVVSTERKLLTVIKKIIDWYAANGNDKERFGTTIKRIGLSNLLEETEFAP